MITIREAACILDSSEEIRQKVAWELIASYPIPTYAAGQLLFLGFYYAKFGPPPAAEDKVYPPNWLATLTSDGILKSLEKHDPSFYGINSPADKPFAKHAYDHPWAGSELAQHIDAFYDTYNGLVKEWVVLLQEDRLRTAETDQKALFRRYFRLLSPACLLGVYLRLGPSFFSWIGLRAD